VEIGDRSAAAEGAGACDSAIWADVALLPRAVAGLWMWTTKKTASAAKAAAVAAGHARFQPENFQPENFQPENKDLRAALACSTGDSSTDGSESDTIVRHSGQSAR
jgi:hypothetical protein